MDAILNFGVAVVLFIQSLGSWLLEPMKLFSLMGNEQFYLFVAPILVWCLDPVLGLRAGLALMISGVFNYIVKMTLTSPRPYWYDARVQPLSSETTFGIPSGHAEHAVVVWGTLAAGTRRRWVWAVAGVLIFLIGFSRLYLGMHFPHDVLGGWLLGGLSLWAILHFERPALNWLQRYKPLEQIVVVFGFSLAGILAGALVRLALGSWVMPANWAALAARQPGGEAVAPLALSGLVSNAAAFFGLAAGAILLHMNGWYSARGSLGQMIVRFVIGILGTFAIWKGLDVLFPDGETLLPFLLRYIRYALVGLWVMYLAPTLFIRLKLAQPAA